MILFLRRYVFLAHRPFYQDAQLFPNILSLKQSLACFPHLLLCLFIEASLLLPLGDVMELVLFEEFLHELLFLFEFLLLLDQLSGFPDSRDLVFIFRFFLSLFIPLKGEDGLGFGNYFFCRRNR